MCFVMATEGLRLAIRLGDVKLASDFTSGLTAFYQVDAWDLKAKTLADLSHGLSKREAKLEIANTSLALAEQALAEGQYRD